MVIAVPSLGALGCSNQSAGQACNLENGSEDCETGLTCISKTVLLTDADICCPADTSDVLVCTPGALSGGGVGGGGGAGGAGGAGGQGGTGGQGGM